MGRGQRCVEMWRVAQRQGAQQVLICHVARRSHLLAQRAVLLWWHVTMESFQDRQRCRWDHLLCLKCLQADSGVGKRCLGQFAKSSPPEPNPEVNAYLQSISIQQRHLCLAKRQKTPAGEDDSFYTAVYTVNSEVLPVLIEDRRKWVLKLLRCILKLGDCEEEATWDKFLWVMLRFCSLNRVELAQTLFLCILRIRDSTTYHYIRYYELGEFFAIYRNCPVKSFDTAEINFDLLPTRRYYASDFAELLMRYPILLHPILHLQQHTPWYPWSGLETGATLEDFFLMETGRIFLRGEPPFRETCDMLCPDALGAVPVNQDQWILRTCFAKNGQGLAQIFVWGEQPLPEVIELKQMAKEEEEERERIRLEKEKREEEEGMEKDLPKERRKGSKEPGSKEEVKLEDMTEEDAKKHRQIQAMAPGLGRTNDGASIGRLRTGVGGDRSVMQTTLDMTALTRTAATMDEEFAAPVDLLPPAWMKHCTIAPAQQKGTDPPLPVVLKQPAKVTYRQTTESDRRKLQRAKRGKEEEDDEEGEGEGSEEDREDRPDNP
eukprot:g3767.t1